MLMNRWHLMEQIAEEGIDFQWFGVPHHYHKADIFIFV